MKQGLAVLLVVVWGVVTSAFAQDVTITYWQYQFDERVEAMAQLIEMFEAENPGIEVVQETFPYADYEAQVGASLPAGVGPDVVQLFYGWLGAWERAGYVEPLPEQYFDATMVDAEFVPMAQAAKRGGVYYGLPTAVRSLAIFYNKDMFAEAGIDGPPETWDDFIEAGQALTQQRGPRYEQIGYGIAPGGQDHHLIREILTRQFGGQPYSDDGTDVMYDEQAGIDALNFYASWVTEHGVGSMDFPGQENNAYRDGFRAQQTVAMIIDGSFAINSVRNTAEFDWGVAEIPVRADNGVQANFGSFWMNGLTANAFEDEATLEASAKFLDFVTSPDAMRLWLDIVGELPARAELIADPELAEDPVFGPFISSLAYAEATRFVDESAQRQLIIDAVNEVLLQDMAVEEAISTTAAEDQALLDEFTQ
ncbi:MAG: extracellular solute-binding protein [Deinococcota bacterium]